MRPLTGFPLRALLSVLAFVTAAVCLPAMAAATDGPTEPDWRAKVDSRLLDERAGPAATEFLVLLARQADLSDLARERSSKRRRRAIVTRLRRAAHRTQLPVVARLEAHGATYRSFWITNMIHVSGDRQLLEELARLPAVERLLANPKSRFSPPRVESARSARAGIEPNLSVVGAPQVWALGVTGAGAVVAGQDTGYRWDHAALKSQYRGWDGSTADHAYNWHDSIHVSAGICGADASAPCDDEDHGTHTMGTMVGDDGGANQIGMAPGARWIGCRNMDAGVGTPASYVECFQWFLAPTDENDLNPDPDAAPHVIGNSWTCTVSEGCVDPIVLQSIVQTVRAAGIFVAVAAANDGPSCSTIALPPSTYDASVTVAATNNSDVVASFSSRGPVTIPGLEGAKPDISAPGVGVRSARKDGAYKTLSGTSMATPHVVGLVALMISANPALAGQVNQLETLIAQTAVPLTTSEGCGGDAENAVPNHTYGHGRIDAHAAVVAALALVPTQLPSLSAEALFAVAALLACLGRHAVRRRERGAVRTR